MITFALFATALLLAALYQLRRVRRLEIEAAQLRADHAALTEATAAWVSAMAETAAELEAERDVARSNHQSEMRSRVACLAEVAELQRRLGPLCNGCGNAIELDVCQCGSPVDGHADEGHTIVPHGCECHIDHQPNWQRVAETRHRLCAVAHLRALRAEGDAAIALAWRATLVRIARDLQAQRDAVSAELERRTADYVGATPSLELT